MDKENEICASCPLKGKDGFMTPSGDGLAKMPGRGYLLILAGFPNQFEFRYGGKPLSSGVWADLQKVVLDCRRKVEAESGSVVVPFTSYAVRCVPDRTKAGRVEATAEVIKKCSAFTERWVDANRPDAILVLGAQAFSSLGFRGAPRNLRGSVLEYVCPDGTKVPAVVGLHPYEAISASPGLTPLFVADMVKAMRLALGGGEACRNEVVVEKDPQRIAELLDAAGKELDAVEGGDAGILVALDTETTSLEPHDPSQRVISVSLSWKGNHGVAFPWEHRDCPFTPEEFSKVRDAFVRFFKNPRVKVCMANGKFDFKWLNLRYGLDIPYQTWDTMLAEHSISEDKKGFYGLKAITRDRLPQYGHYEDELEEEKNAVWKAKDDEVARLKEEFKEGEEKALQEWWLGLDVERRREMMQGWVERRYIDFSDFSNLLEVKRRKVKGELVITKKYLASVVKMVKNVPRGILVAHGALDGRVFSPPPHLLEKTYEDVPLDKLLWYGAMDALCTREIAMQQVKDFRRDDRVKNSNTSGGKGPAIPSLMWPYKNITLPLCRNLALMEYGGIRMDRELLGKYRERLAEYAGELEESMFRDVGRRFNPNAAADLLKVLYGDLGYVPDETRLTATGERSVSEDTLNDLSYRYRNEGGSSRFIDTLLTYRKVSKCLKTYLKNWMDMSERDGRIHCSFLQTGTVTYRLSSQNPNLQNVPFKISLSGDEMLNLKALFVPDEGYDIYDLDISNAEMRVLTGYSRDASLTDAFNTGKDLHCLTAASISDFTYDDILAKKEDKTTAQYQQRQIAKKVNFGRMLPKRKNALNCWKSTGAWGRTGQSAARAGRDAREWFRDWHAPPGRKGMRRVKPQYGAPRAWNTSYSMPGEGIVHAPGNGGPHDHLRNEPHEAPGAAVE